MADDETIDPGKVCTPCGSLDWCRKHLTCSRTGARLQAEQRVAGVHEVACPKAKDHAARCACYLAANYPSEALSALPPRSVLVAAGLLRELLGQSIVGFGVLTSAAGPAIRERALLDLKGAHKLASEIEAGLLKAHMLKDRGAEVRPASVERIRELAARFAARGEAEAAFTAGVLEVAAEEIERLRAGVYVVSDTGVVSVTAPAVDDPHVVDVCRAFGWRHDFAASGPLTWAEILPELEKIGAEHRERKKRAADVTAAPSEPQASVKPPISSARDPFVTTLLGSALGGLIAGMVGGTGKVERAKPREGSSFFDRDGRPKRVAGVPLTSKPVGYLINGKSTNHDGFIQPGGTFSIELALNPQENFDAVRFVVPLAIRPHFSVDSVIVERDSLPGSVALDPTPDPDGVTFLRLLDLATSPGEYQWEALRVPMCALRGKATVKVTNISSAARAFEGGIVFGFQSEQIAVPPDRCAKPSAFSWSCMRERAHDGPCSPHTDEATEAARVAVRAQADAAARRSRALAGFDKDAEASDVIDHPPHYAGSAVEPIDAIEAWGFGPGFNLGNAVKYIARAGKKDPAKLLEDLQKARWYLDREIGTLEAAAAAEAAATKTGEG